MVKISSENAFMDKTEDKHCADDILITKWTWPLKNTLLIAKRPSITKPYRPVTQPAPTSKASLI